MITERGCAARAGPPANDTGAGADSNYRWRDVGSPDEVEDVANDAFCRALELRRCHRDTDRDHVAAALAIARNAAEQRFLEKRLRTCAGA